MQAFQIPYINAFFDRFGIDAGIEMLLLHQETGKLAQSMLLISAKLKGEHNAGILRTRLYQDRRS